MPTKDAWPAQIEYEQAHEWWRHLSNLRRQDLALFTTIQGAALTIIGDQLLSLKPANLALSVVAFLSALIGLNNERRVYAYLVGFRERALELERLHGASLMGRGVREAQNTQLLVKTQVAFAFFYLLLLAGWILIWVLNGLGVDG